MCAPAAACAKPMAARRKRKRWEDTLQWWDTLLLVPGGVGFVCGILVGVLEGMGCIQCFQKRKKESGTYKYNWETQAYEYTPPGAESIGRATPSACVRMKVAASATSCVSSVAVGSTKC